MTGNKSVREVPRRAVALLRRLLPSESRRDVEGDLEERFRRMCTRRGTRRARLWYWWQVIEFLVRLPRTRLPGHPRRRAKMISSTLSDARYAVRGLVARPFFAALVIGTLALAVGANTAIFSVVNGLLLRPLDYPEPDRLVRIYQYYTRAGQPEEFPDSQNVVSPIDYLDFRDQLDTFSAITAMGNFTPTGFDLTGLGTPQRLASLPVTADYFDVFGVRPVLGRAFDRREEDGSSQVVLVSDALWRGALGADPAVIGRTIQLDGTGWEVIGVMPAGFVDVVGRGVDVWVPQNMGDTWQNSRGNHYMHVVGRLAPGLSVAESQQQLDTFSEQLQQLYPDTNEGRYTYVVALHDDVLGSADTMLWVLLGATGLVLLIGCVNVANLLIGRGLERRREFAVRAALGSGRTRLIRQLITESILLALLGGLGGVVLAAAMTRTLLRLAPESLTVINPVSFDARVLGFALLMSCVTAIIFGVGPALRAAGPDLEHGLREGARGTDGRATHRLRGALVVAEVALALVLLAGAGLLVRSVQIMQSRDLGFEPGGVMTFEIRLPDSRFPSGAERQALHEELHRRLRTVPGVVAAGAVQWLPGTGSTHTWGFRVEDAAAPGGFRRNSANIRVIAGDYLAAAGLPLLRGRPFGPEHELGTPFVGYVNEAAAAAAWPDGSDPVGQTIQVGGQEMEIIGIVGDTLLGPTSGAASKVYFSHAQYADDRNWSLFQMVRVEGAGPELMSTIREQVAMIDPDLVVFNARTLEAAVGVSATATRFAMVLLAGFAAVAALLAALGTYGVLSYSVGQRGREIGIRMALGAETGQVQSMVIRQGLVFAAIGAGVGLAGALATARVMETLVYGVSTSDPLVLFIVALLMTLVSLLAAWVPARRAARVSPIRVLR